MQDRKLRMWSYCAALCGQLFLLAMLPALAEDCDVRNRNLPLLREGESQASHGRYGGIGAHWNYGVLLPERTATDVPTRTTDYLVDPIASVTDLAAADKQAERLEHHGQTLLAKKIRERMRLACTFLYGRQMSSQQTSCMSTAERLRKSAWNLEVEQQLPLAEKSYRGVCDIYLKEMGDSVLTANSLADLARVCHEEKKTEESIKLLAQAVAIYDRHPQYADTEMASALELYGGIMGDKKNSTMAAALAKRAASVRKRAYGGM